MTNSPTLNTAKPYQWACVVSGVTWGEYKLSSDGKFTAETVRGPLIVWATKHGEGESVPTLQPPTLSALEEQVAKLNTQAAFERLFWAARGKVRASVRWKTKGKTRRLRKLEALDRVRYISKLEARRAKGLSGSIISGSAPRTTKGKREGRRFAEQERIEERLRGVFVDLEEIQDGETFYYAPCIDDVLLKVAKEVADALKKHYKNIKRYKILIEIDHNLKSHKHC